MKNKRIWIFTILALVTILAFTFIATCWGNSPVTLYASDGRTRQVDADDVERWVAVGWFRTPEEAKIITLYSTDGRTLDIPEYYRETYNNVGWYNTKEEVMVRMYSTDGRTLEVFKDLSEAHHQVGWYYNLSDVTVKMYDSQGNEYTVFKDNIDAEKEKGLTTNINEVRQLMFSADGRFMHISFDEVQAYNEVGWYTGGTNKVDPSRPMVAITFDDGPGKHTDRILSILEKYNARATFFVQGKYVSKYKNTLARAVNNGNEIGNHTWSHVKLSASSVSTIGSQISSTNNAVYNATGVYPKLYRPPYGAYNKSVLNSVSMPAIMWSVDTLDWKTRNASKTLASVQKSAHDGAIILMHDIHAPTADAVEPVVKHLLMQGYQLVTVSELLDARCGGGAGGRVYTGAPAK